jgi:hypothetical protein
MKSNKLRKLVAVFGLLAILASFSSCNRGYGCPNNFSISDPVIELVKGFAQTIIK